MTKYSVVNDLMERNIEIEGEEYYAVLCAFVKKISALNEIEMKDERNLLKAAARYEVTGDEEALTLLNKALSAYLEGLDKEVVQLCMSKAENAEKIEALNDFAILLGAQRRINENIFRSRQYADINDILLAERESYDVNKSFFKNLIKLAYNDDNLETFIRKSAGQVSTPMEAIKTMVKSNLETEQDKFLDQQCKYVGNAVSLIVEDCSRILMHKNNANEAVLQAS